MMRDTDFGETLPNATFWSKMIAGSPFAHFTCKIVFDYIITLEDIACPLQIIANWSQLVKYDKDETDDEVNWSQLVAKDQLHLNLDCNQRL